MPYYVTVSVGPRADQAEPVLALSDRRAVRAVLRAISRMADRDDSGVAPTPLRVVASVPKAGGSDASAH